MMKQFKEFPNFHKVINISWICDINIIDIKIEMIVYIMIRIAYTLGILKIWA